MPSETDYALAAGILLGEGCLSIYLRSKQKRFSPRVWIGMQDKGTIEWLHKTFGGGMSKKAMKSGLWAWWLEGRKCVHTFLWPTMKYMEASTEKYPQAWVMIYFCTMPYRQRYAKVVWNEAQYELAKELHDEIARLKPRNKFSGGRSRFVQNLLIPPTQGE